MNYRELAINSFTMYEFTMYDLQERTKHRQPTKPVVRNMRTHN